MSKKTCKCCFRFDMESHVKLMPERAIVDLTWDSMSNLCKTWLTRDSMPNLNFTAAFDTGFRVKPTKKEKHALFDMDFHVKGASLVHEPARTHLTWDSMSKRSKTPPAQILHPPWVRFT